MTDHLRTLPFVASTSRHSHHGNINVIATVLLFVIAIIQQVDDLGRPTTGTSITATGAIGRGARRCRNRHRRTLAAATLAVLAVVELDHLVVIVVVNATTMAIAVVAIVIIIVVGQIDLHRPAHGLALPTTARLGTTAIPIPTLIRLPACQSRRCLHVDQIVVELANAQNGQAPAGRLELPPEVEEAHLPLLDFDLGGAEGDQGGTLGGDGGPEVVQGGAQGEGYLFSCSFK